MTKPTRWVLPEDAAPPRGWVQVHIPGMKAAWVESDFAARLGELCAMNKAKEAKTLLLWMGGKEEA